MPQQPADEDSAALIVEATHNAFYYFLRAVDILKEEPERQCQLMGDYNTAWELQSDIGAGRYLIGKGILDRGDEDAIAALADAVGAVPTNTLPAGPGRERNLAAMQHAAWVPLRKQAAQLRTCLQPAAARTYAYLNMPPDLPGSGLS
jgi:hypothetical protein